MPFDIEPPMPTINMTLENGDTVECDVLCIFDCAEYPDKEYIALMPRTFDGSESDVFLNEYVEQGENDAELLSIENDEEFDAVTKRFYEWLDEE